MDCFVANAPRNDGENNLLWLGMATLIYRDRKFISAWLLCCLLLVGFMVVVGGYTRLSGSGLSITEWKPIYGVIPPIGEAEWEEVFAGYKQIPQYAALNAGMTLEAFKAIYWPEYFHRLLGRALGIVFLIPFIMFAVRRSFSRTFALRLGGIFLLGGLQGFIGWYMVSSGLVHNTHVSHLRLALHLSVAFAIFAGLLWMGLSLPRSGGGLGRGYGENSTPSRPSAFAKALADKSATLPPLGGGYIIWFSLLCLQIIVGALTAGLHGGMVYNTWPDMNGQWLPAELSADNPLENPVLMQFIHRWLAVIVTLGFFLWWSLHRQPVIYNAALAVALLIGFQFTLGVLTLVNVVPLPLALMHQVTGLLLFGGAIILWRAIASAQDLDPAQPLRVSQD
jgi:cytochrome c oxidase assembly protein subunit 15